MNWYKIAQNNNIEKVYHGGRNIGSNPELSRGYQGTKKNPETGEYERTGYDMGGIFVSPDLDYAKSYQKSEDPGLYESEIPISNIFDATDDNHWEIFKKSLLNSQEYDTPEDAMSDYIQIKKLIQESVQHGYPDWATVSQFSEEIENSGFDGIKMLERPAGFMHDKPIVSYALFKKIKSKRHLEQGTYRDIKDMPYFNME
jgi:hypothetical protein